MLPKILEASMKKVFLGLNGVIAVFIFMTSSFGLVIPTQNKNVDVYLGLFGSTSNPALRTGCYTNKTNVLTGKQLIEYQYTAMDCVDSVSKLATPGMMMTSSGAPALSDDMMRFMLVKAGAFQLGLNFSFNS